MPQKLKPLGIVRRKRREGVDVGAQGRGQVEQRVVVRAGRQGRLEAFAGQPRLEGLAHRRALGRVHHLAFDRYLHDQNSRPRPAAAGTGGARNGAPKPEKGGANLLPIVVVW